jgi:hypothetical protein
MGQPKAITQAPFHVAAQATGEVAEKTDIEVRALLTTAPAVAAGSAFDVVLVDN